MCGRRQRESRQVVGCHGNQPGQLRMTDARTAVEHVERRDRVQNALGDQIHIAGFRVVHAQIEDVRRRHARLKPRGHRVFGRHTVAPDDRVAQERDPRARALRMLAQIADERTEREDVRLCEAKRGLRLVAAGFSRGEPAGISRSSAARHNTATTACRATRRRSRRRPQLQDCFRQADQLIVHIPANAAADGERRRSDRFGRTRPP